MAGGGGGGGGGGGLGHALPQNFRCSEIASEAILGRVEAEP